MRPSIHNNLQKFRKLGSMCSVVPTTTTWWGSPESLKHEEQSQTAQNNHQKKAHAQTIN